MVNDNEFFRNVTLRICGHLEIEEGLQSCIDYISQHLPANMLYLQRHEHDVGAMRVIARADAEKGEKMDVLVPYSEEAKAAMGQMASVWRAGKMPPVLVINRPEEEPVTRCMLEALGEPTSSAMSLPLFIGDAIVGALVLLARGNDRFSDHHAHLYSTLKEPFFVAMSNTLKHAEVVDLSVDLLNAHQGLIMSLAELAESRDQSTGAHLYRVRDHCTLLATLMRQDPRFEDEVSSRFIEAIHHVSPLHDIGKVGVPDSILLKQGKLTDDEFEIMKTHTTIGGRSLDTVLKYCDLDMFRMAYDLVLSHHERYDGRGYPNGLKGDGIPLAARIMTIVDVYDALRSARVYKAAFTSEEAAKIIREEAGKGVDPVIAEIMLAHIGEFCAVHEGHTAH